MESSKRAETCKKCGSVYERSEQIAPNPILALFKCEVCGEPLEYATAAALVTYRLVRSTGARRTQ